MDFIIESRETYWNSSHFVTNLNRVSPQNFHLENGEEKKRLKKVAQ
jgi:hypothetical protein